MDVFESTILDAIRQEKYTSVLAWTKGDFYEYGAEVFGGEQVEKVILQLEEMQHTPNISAEFKFMIFMGRYNYYECMSRGYDLLAPR